jgi:hypothetical protein
MNCQRCQQKILDSLSADESVSQEVSAHRNSCAMCREFHLSQQNLFHAVDAGLHAIANPPIPPSLLPGLRVRLEENPTVSRATFPDWGLAVLTTALVLMLFGALALRQPSLGPHYVESTTILPQPLAKPDSPAPATSKPPAISTEHRIKSTASRTSQPAAPEPEVIVLAEERQAFAKYLAAAPEQRDVPLMPASPVQPVSDGSQEIALVKIESLEVPPLQGAVDK